MGRKLVEILKKDRESVDRSMQGDCFCATTNDIASGTGGQESAQVLIQNPINSKVLMRIHSLVLNTTVSSGNNIFRLYKDPVYIGAGTPLPITCLYLKATPPVPKCLVYKLPTTTSFGTLFRNYIVGPTTSYSVPLKYDLILEPGRTLLITVRPNSAGVFYAANPEWAEEEAV